VANEYLTNYEKNRGIKSPALIASQIPGSLKNTTKVVLERVGVDEITLGVNIL
jgi:hypothetical protein